VKSYIDDFFESRYEAELEQKQKLDTADSFLVGIVAGLLGVGAYYLQTLARARFGFASCCLWLLTIPYFAALIVALYHVGRSIWPQRKCYVASPKEWADYVDGYEKHYGHWHKDPDLSERVALELSKLRRQQYVEAGENNRRLVLRKHDYQTKAKRAIVVAVVLMLFSSLPGYCVQRTLNGDNKNEPATATATATATAPDSNGSPVAADSAPANVTPASPDSADRN
jgi:hypothetical protein